MKYEIPQELLTPHSKYSDSVQWSLTEQGIKVGSGDIERTSGEPSTVTRIWNDYNGPINEYAEAYNVPVELIIATIATETSGQPNKVREEPGYISDEETPE